ncbi:hypothetical protein CANCADRAFT_117708 [Tortispora caseinolytica NRRL Y-17796]|uniref:Oxidation resistance protein 1 n=1 Tax=Tortispora caseinolytica NRRL Y-17796 TaxID=767744 RepID=A0A1E4THE8_9ASCO|nr:hypothetical protein CANCADRAFT_117708 [Tortispora caseinolytica NRRL Y-17796]
MKPTLPPLTLHGITDETPKVLTSELAEEIRQLVPSRLQMHSSWSLLYSLSRDGVSLSTLYAKSAPTSKMRAQNVRSGYILAVKDTSGNRFGCYLNEPPQIPPNGRYYGNSECFLWLDDVNDVFKVFPYSGLNNYIAYGEADYLSIGGGDGKSGLWLNSDLSKGVSDQCLTFGNEPLSRQGSSFNILGVEVWIVDPLHSSYY